MRDNKLLTAKKVLNGDNIEQMRNEYDPQVQKVKKVKELEVELKELKEELAGKMEDDYPGVKRFLELEKEINDLLNEYQESQIQTPPK